MTKMTDEKLREIAGQLDECRLSEAELELCCKDLDFRIEGLEADLAASEARVLVLEGALRRAAGWFEDYERQHRFKGTADGELKADTNQERAAFLRAALAATQTDEVTE